MCPQIGSQTLLSVKGSILEFAIKRINQKLPFWVPKKIYEGFLLITERHVICVLNQCFIKVMEQLQYQMIILLKKKSIFIRL